MRKLYFLLTTRYKKKKNINLARIKFGYTVQEDCMLYVFMTGDIDLQSISFMYGML